MSLSFPLSVPGTVITMVSCIIVAAAATIGPVIRILPVRFMAGSTTVPETTKEQTTVFVSPAYPSGV
jgi:hypothetical protein